MLCMLLTTHVPTYQGGGSVHGELYHSSGQPLFALLWQVRQTQSWKFTCNFSPTPQLIDQLLALLVLPATVSSIWSSQPRCTRALCQREPDKVLELEDLHKESLRAADILGTDRQDAGLDSDDEGSAALDKRVSLVYDLCCTCASSIY